MSAAPLPQSPRSRPKTSSRQALAFRAGEDALGRSAHGVGLLQFYKYIVARAGRETSCVISTNDAARDISVDPRTIRRYGPLLEAAGLIRRDDVRRGMWRYTITAYEPAPVAVPEVVAIEPDPFFSGPPSGSIDPDKRIDRSVPSFNGSKDLQEEACRPGGETGSAAKGFFGREEQTNPETVQLLRAEHVSPASCRQLGSLQPAYVREQIAAARRCGRAREWPAFLVGILRTGGVFGSSSLGDMPPVRCSSCGAALAPGTRCPRCYPEEPPPDESLTALWRRVVAAVDVSADDRRIWLEQTALLQLDGDVAIVGTANVFVRNEVRDRFAHLLVRPLAADLGRAIAIEVVIGGGTWTT